MSKYSEDVRSEAANAAAYIRKNGWCQGNYYAGNSCCALGAARIATGQEDDNTPLSQAFAKEAGLDRWGVPNWNDAPGRTKEEVLEVFDRIANS